MSKKPSNPKDAIGSDKLPLHLWPATATAVGCLAFLNGALKYGRSNFRVVGVRASIYIDAAKRHMDAWFEGEENDPDDGVPHLSAALACLAVIVDARAAGKLTDDRMVRGGYRTLVQALTPEVKRLKDMHRACTPMHYTIIDNDATEASDEASPAPGCGVRNRHHLGLECLGPAKKPKKPRAPARGRGAVPPVSGNRRRAGR